MAVRLHAYLYDSSLFLHLFRYLCFLGCSWRCQSKSLAFSRASGHSHWRCIGADLVVLMTHWSLWGNHGDDHKMYNMYQYVTRAYRILLAKETTVKETKGGCFPVFRNCKNALSSVFNRIHIGGYTFQLNMVLPVVMNFSMYIYYIYMYILYMCVYTYTIYICILYIYVYIYIYIYIYYVSSVHLIGSKPHWLQDKPVNRWPILGTRAVDLDVYWKNPKPKDSTMSQ